MLDAFTQCGSTPCMRYIIEAIRDYDQVKPEHMTYLLIGMSSVQNPSPYLFAEVIVSGHFLLKWFSYLRACMCGFSQLTPAEHKSLATKRRVTKAVYYWRNRNLKSNSKLLISRFILHTFILLCYRTSCNKRKICPRPHCCPLEL